MSENSDFMISDINLNHLPPVYLAWKKPDLFVRLSVNGLRKETSLSFASFQPQWKSETFKFSVEGSITAKPVLDLQVFQKSSRNSHEKLRSFASMQIELGGTVPSQDFHLMLAKKGVIKGDIRFRITQVQGAQRSDTAYHLSVENHSQRLTAINNTVSTQEMKSHRSRILAFSSAPTSLEQHRSFDSSVHPKGDTGGTGLRNLPSSGTITNPDIPISLGQRLESLVTVADVNSENKRLMGDAVKSLNILVNLFGKVAHVNPAVVAACGAVTSALKVIESQTEQDHTVLGIAKQLRDMLVFSRNVTSMRQLEGGLDILSGMLKAIESAAKLIEEYLKVPFGVRLTKGLFWDKMGPRLENSEDDLQYWQKLFSQTVAIQMFNTVEDVSQGVTNLSQRLHSMENQMHQMRASGQNVDDHLKILRALPRIHQAMFDRVKMCSKGTRMELLHSVIEWARNTDEKSPRIFWINGQAGMGKSTIAATVSHALREENMLGGDFFFSRSVAERTSPDGVFGTVAYQLATRIATVRQGICDAIHEEPDIANLAVSTQWKSLIKGPLIKSGQWLNHNVVVVLDALDECGSPLDIIQNIGSDIASLPPWFKLFCTSRSERQLELAFKRMGEYVHSQTLAATDAQNTRDLTVYISERLTYIAEKHDLQETNTNWPGYQRTEALVVRAAGLFIWAATAADFIDDEEICDPDAQLEVILGDEVDQSMSPWVSLDSLYTQVLRRATPANASGARRNIFFRILGGIIIAKDPLSIPALVRLLDIQSNGTISAINQVKQSISKIQPVLFIPQAEHETVRIIHKSFADFLTNPARCQEKGFYIDPQLHHRFITLRCLQLMDEHLCTFECGDLKVDMLNDDIPDLNLKFSDRIPLELRYACIFWAEHLCEANSEAEIFDLLRSFYSAHFLSWLEVLSIVGSVSTAQSSLISARDWLKKHYGHHQDALCDLAQDCLRFVTEFGEPIEQSAPHIRHSALTLAPRALPISTAYSSQLKPEAIRFLYGPSMVWPGWAAVMDGHTDSAYSVAFAPNGQLVCSGSEDRTIRIWNAKLKTAIGGELAGHHGTVMAVLFEPDNEHIISGSQDGTLRRWNIASGDQVGDPLRGHSGWVTSLASACRKGRSMQLISGSMDGSVRVWDVETGTGSELCRLTSGVLSVAFKPDGKQFACGTQRNEIIRWHFGPCAAFGEPLLGHTDQVNGLSYSPDGKSLVSCSHDKTLRIWSAVDHQSSGKLCVGHGGPVFSVAYSPNGKIIASGSLDATVRIWNADSGEPLGRILAQTDAVLAVAVSPDGETIMAANYDFSIRVWNVQDAMRAEENLSRAQEGTVLSVNWSHDGRRIVLGSSAGSLEMIGWDPQKTLFKCDEAHQGPIYIANFSPDDSLILTGSYDTTLKQWNPATGRQIRVTLTGHTERVFHAAYSSDGTKIVSGSADCTVRIWDALQGQQVGSWSLRHDWPIYSVAYNPCGGQVASGCQDGILRVWDLNTGALVAEVTGECKSITAIEYSADGKTLLATSIDGMAIYLNPETGSRQKADLFTRSITFSLESGWLHDLSGRRLCWLPSEYRADFRPAIYNKYLFATPNCSQKEKITIFDLSPLKKT